MLNLSSREEQIMHAFWQVGKGLIRDIIPLLPDPKPHYNIVATTVKILEDKGYLAHEVLGNMFCYYTLINKEEYITHILKDVVNQYFENSYPKMLAFFADQQQLTESDLTAMVEMVAKKKI